MTRSSREHTDISIPRISGWLVRIFLSDYTGGPVLGDLDEEFFLIAEEEGPAAARRWYSRQVRKSLFPILIHWGYWKAAMLRSYMLTAWRNIKKNRVYSLINIAGLAMAIACCVLIYLFVADELSFDRFHENRDQLFRVVRVNYNNMTGRPDGTTPYLPTAMGPELEQYLDEITHMTRVISGSGVVRYRDRIFQETIQMADASFFSMFSFPLVSGHPGKILSGSGDIVLTRSCAERYFGSEDPTGRTLSITFGQKTGDFLVTGVAEDVPHNSSIQFQMVINIANLPVVNNNPGILRNWNRWYLPFFIRLREGASLERVRKGLDHFCRQNFADAIEKYKQINSWTRESMPFSFDLQRADRVYLDTRGLTPSLLLLLVAGIILLIASVNYTNMSIGLSAIRSREVGVRKVLGAERKHLVHQFWGQAVMTSLLAMFFGLLVTAFVLPEFNELSGKHLSMEALFRGNHILAVLIIAIAAGLIAGSYPAFVISGFKPADILKNRLHMGGRSLLTRGLIILQFSLSIILVISSIVLGRQAGLLINRDVGYDKEGLVVVRTQENEQNASEILYRRFRNRIIFHNHVLGVTASNREFGLFLPGTMLKFGNKEVHFRFNRVDPHFVSTLGLRLVEGRDFSPRLSADKNAVLVNEQFIKALGTGFRRDIPLGDISNGFPASSKIIGVLEDSHFRSLRSEIEPLLLYVGRGFSPRRDLYSRIMVRIRSDQVRETITFLQETWKEIQPDKPFISYLQEDALESQYIREKQWSVIIQYASILSVLIACLGVFGLTAITLSRRVKEIGIRKVLGAGIHQIVLMILREFLVLVVLANLIAWPVSYWVLERVLENYPFRTGIDILFFISTGFGMVLLTSISVMYLSLKSALTNPVHSLRYE
jgi:putative ABC transport system permease protein